MPGLVNAHCHLDYTHMAGQLPPPKRFSDWLRQITEIKAGWDYPEYATSWRAGAAMLLRTGTTTVADIEAVSELLPEMWDSTPLRVISFLEMIGITGRRTAADILSETRKRLEQLGANPDRAGLSPHAPYSTLPDLLRLTSAASRRHGWRVVVHVAESAAEYEMFRHGRGEMFEWIKRAQRDVSDCGRGTPVQHLETCGLLGRKVMAVHANYLGRNDPALLARRGASVVHCARSHSYFAHDRFPLRRLMKAGVNVCLGTDSLASVYVSRRQKVELNMFEELRALAKAEPMLKPGELLRMATVNGARALGLQGKIGVLKRNAFADLICLPFQGDPAKAEQAALAHRGMVHASMIEGHWAIPPAL